MKKIIIFMVLLISALTFTACSSSSDADTSSSDSDDTLQVYVSFNAMYEFATAVGGDKVEVTTIIPSGTEPHDFEPTASDIAGVSDADVFIYNGLGMESWAEEAIDASENDDLVVIVASDSLSSIENTDEDVIEEEGEYDPHVWLSLKDAEVEVQNIADGLSEADPDNADYYQDNAAAYIEKIEALYNEYAEKFATVTNTTFVTGHAAFNYFCEDFGLTQNSVEDVYAEGEPSTSQLAELVDYCLENNVTTIFAEELASTEVSETLADEVGAQVETIYTIEGEEDDLTYIERMESNCEKIYESLVD